jgi:hypothetical protein
MNPLYHLSRLTHPGARALAALVLVAGVASPPHTHASLVLYLDFESGFQDASGVGNDAIVDSRSAPGSISTASSGVSGNALSIQNGLGWLTVPDSQSISPTSALTMSAWVKPTGQIGNNSGIFFKGALDGQQPDWQLVIGDVGTGGLPAPSGAATTLNGTGFATSEASVVDFGFLNPIPLNEWTHLASTYDGSELRLYVNSTLVGAASYANPINDTGSPLYIGNRFRPAGDVGGFQGFLDELRLYDRALDPSEILALASGGTSELLPVLPGGRDGLSYTFDLLPTGDGATVWVDPDVSVGFDFSSDSGQVFGGVTMPSFGTVPQTNPYEIYIDTGSELVLAALLEPGQRFEFGEAVDWFRIGGIDEFLGLDPDDPLAFPTGIDFAVSERIAFNMTPLLASPREVPGPGTVGILASGLLFLCLHRRRSFASVRATQASTPTR